LKTGAALLPPLAPKYQLAMRVLMAGAMLRWPRPINPAPTSVEVALVVNGYLGGCNFPTRNLTGLLTVAQSCVLDLRGS
jgi:hypothetical protein